MISPDFWTDTAMIQLPMPVRLFYIGTWNFACSAGHLPDDPMQLKLKVLPAEMIDANEFITQLVDAGRMRRVTLPDGTRFLVIPAFTKHQKQDSRYQSRCPACRSLTEPHQNSPELAESHRNSPIGGGGGGGGGGVGDKGEGESRADALNPPPKFCPQHPSGTTGKCGPCGDARRIRKAWDEEQAHKPTPTPKRAPDCPHHPNWPLPCDKCKQIAAEM